MIHMIDASQHMLRSNQNLCFPKNSSDVVPIDVYVCVSSTLFCVTCVSTTNHTVTTSPRLRLVCVFKTTVIWRWQFQKNPHTLQPNPTSHSRLWDFGNHKHTRVLWWMRVLVGDWGEGWSGGGVVKSHLTHSLEHIANQPAMATVDQPAIGTNIHLQHTRRTDLTERTESNWTMPAGKLAKLASMSDMQSRSAQLLLKWTRGLSIARVS